MSTYLAPTRGPAPPIIIEPEAESNETSPQDHDRSRGMVRSVDASTRPRSRSPFGYFRKPNGNSTLSSMVIPTLTTVQDPAGVGTYEVKVIHDWASDLMKATKDMVKKLGHTESSPEPGVYKIVFEPGGDSFPARVELSHSRRNSILQITNLSTMKEVVGAALLPRSLANHLHNSARLGLAPNTLHKTIYVDYKELKLCEVVLATCAFPECPYFHPKRTYRWYWVIVNDEENVLEGRAFIPYNVGPREEMTLLPTRTGMVPFPTH